jgi:hypothetical protein
MIDAKAALREVLRGTTWNYRGQAWRLAHEVFALGASARGTDAFVILRE